MPALDSTKMDRLLREMERNISELRAHLIEAQPESGWMTWFRRSGGFLAAMDQRGGRLHHTEISDLAREHGYDPRGLAGFYGGAQRSLARDGDDRVLTEIGRRNAEQWRRLFGHNGG